MITSCSTKRLLGPVLALKKIKFPHQTRMYLGNPVDVGFLCARLPNNMASSVLQQVHSIPNIHYKIKACETGKFIKFFSRGPHRTKL
jgi:hypothetical protein